MKWWMGIVRIWVTAFLLYKVYGETGPWTVFCLALVCVFAETESWLVNQNIELTKTCAAKIKELFAHINSEIPKDI